MRFALFALVAAATALAQPTARDAPKFNPAAPLPGFSFSAVAAVPAVPTTSGKRFEQGLPPLKPRVRRHRGGPHVGYLPGTRVRSAPRAETSPTPSAPVTCNPLAVYPNGTEYGYVVPKFNEFGEYYQFQPTQDGALLVSFPFSPDSPSELSLTVKNNDETASWPFFGGVAGYGATDTDFGPGSFNYAYLAGTTPTSPGSPAVVGPNSFSASSGEDQGIETAIWTYDPATMALTPQWINSDGSAVATFFTYTQGVLTITGDPEALDAVFGPITVLNLKCVPPVTDTSA